MSSASPLTQFDGFIGAAVLNKKGEVMEREGEDFEVKQVYALLQETGALLNSGALGSGSALKKITGESILSPNSL